MAIDEAQLETWSHQGSTTQSSNTYQSIKNALEAADTPYTGKKYKVFLQGSYGNDTNIWAESDVDIVIQLDDCFNKDLSEITDDQKNAFNEYFDDAKYTHIDFKKDVLRVLTDNFGDDVKAGDKAIAINANGNRRKADVIAAIQYRRYYKFNGIQDQSYVEGICFCNSKGEQIANYPKQHSANLTVKHQASNMWLKPMVRVLKNIRSKCVEDGLLMPGVAPSYFIEGLIYNVPKDKFTSSYQDCFMNAFNWLQEEADKDKLLCANEQYFLLRDSSSVCQPKKNGQAFIDAAIKLWNNW